MAEPTTPGKGAGNKHRERSAERNPDLETTIEDEMRSSGRTGVVPRTAVIGAHPSAVTPTTADINEVELPRTSGTDDVAPTARALERERIRHERQADVGVFPAGMDGRVRQERPANIAPSEARDVRAALDRAAEDADFEVTVTEETPAPRQESRRQPRPFPRGIAYAGAAALMLGAGLVGRAIYRGRH